MVALLTAEASVHRDPPIPARRDEFLPGRPTGRDRGLVPMHDHDVPGAATDRRLLVLHVKVAAPACFERDVETDRDCSVNTLQSAGAGGSFVIEVTDRLVPVMADGRSAECEAVPQPACNIGHGRPLSGRSGATRSRCDFLRTLGARAAVKVRQLRSSSDRRDQPLASRTRSVATSTRHSPACDNTPVSAQNQVAGCRLLCCGGYGACSAVNNRLEG